MKNKLLYCNLRFPYQTDCKISNFFLIVKNKISLLLRSGIVYISTLVGKRVTGDKDSAIKKTTFILQSRT